MPRQLIEAAFIDYSATAFCNIIIIFCDRKSAINQRSFDIFVNCCQVRHLLEVPCKSQLGRVEGHRNNEPALREVKKNIKIKKKNDGLFQHMHNESFYFYFEDSISKEFNI